jgi:UDP-glucose 4-epimerase
VIILVTGGAGFIGSHTCAELLRNGHEVVIADDYSNSSPAAVAAIREMSGASLAVHEVDLRDRHALARVFTAHRIDAVIHFAAKKSVRESVRLPLDYYAVNVGGTISLITTMLEHHVHQLVFSSSCSIYGDRYSGPISEDDETGPTNPYARSKLICEQILADACPRYPELSVIALRYFNPVGAHPGGGLGEDPRGVPSNVLPYMMQVALRLIERLDVYGGDYDTADGSGVRDYIHVMDVAEAHCLALDHLADETGKRALNLGTGHGVSVLQLLATFQAVTGTTIPYRMVGRQPGDVGTLIADPARIEKLWGWRTSRDLGAMCRDAWQFQSLHPGGYEPTAAMKSG